MGPVVLSAGDRRQRAAARAKAGPLRNLVIRPRTLERYEAALDTFRLWLSREQGTALRSGTAWPSSAAELDLLVSWFIENLWEEGEPKSYAGDTLSALQHKVPALKGHLLAS